ncbi:Gp49 family protein [Acinetobacter baumannii]
MTKDVIEQELVEKSEAPRVTKSQIDALMERVSYTVEQCPGVTTSTFVHAFLDGKFFLASGFSACVNAENFDAEIGERIARSNAEKSAENKLWELEGYRLFATNF